MLSLEQWIYPLKMLSNNNKVLSNFKLPSDWKYRGEGNCNVVISLPKSKKILRIRKAVRPKSIFGWLLTWLSDLIYWYFGNNFKEEKVDVKFYMKIMRPLFGKCYVSEATQVSLSRKQISQLERELDEHRPDFRKHKILQYGRATLFDDFTNLRTDYMPFKLSKNTFSFEIKPKQGWKSFTDKQFPECIFCMHQFLKKQNKRINKISKYCPEDLFSGKRDRVRSALQALIATPQNNFRVFKNGNVVYDDKLHSKFDSILDSFFESDDSVDNLQEEFYDLMKKCLTENLICADSKEQCDRKLFCEWNKLIQSTSMNYSLQQGSVLEKILSAQMLDTEGTNYYGKLLKNKIVKDWWYVKKVLKEVNNHPKTCLKCTIMMLGNNEITGEVNDLIFVPYLISSVAKDCSLMLTFVRIQEDVTDTGLKNVVETKYGSFIVRIGIFDLYPKPLSTIKKHEERNKNILQAYHKLDSK